MAWCVSLAGRLSSTVNLFWDGIPSVCLKGDRIRAQTRRLEATLRNSMNNKHTERRKAFTSIGATIGTGLMLTGVNATSLPAKQRWLLGSLGMVINVIVILLSGPIKVDFLSPRRIYRHIYVIALWWLRGPRCAFSIPSITQKSTEEGSDWTATLTLTVQNRDEYPIDVNPHSALVYIEQTVGRQKMRSFLEGRTSGVEISPKSRRTFEVIATSFVHGDHRCWYNPKRSRWGIRGITVTLNGGYTRELHTGLHFETPGLSLANSKAVI